MTALYTKSTLLGEDVNSLSQNCCDDGPNDDITPAGYLMCISESSAKEFKLKHDISIVAVQPGTGKFLISNSFSSNADQNGHESCVQHAFCYYCLETAGSHKIVIILK